MSASISDLVVALQNAVNAINTGANAVQGIHSTLSAPTSWQQIAGLSHSDPPNIINVKDPPYNALGNGVANDQPAIQSALTAINTNFTGGVVLFPSGTYLVGAPGLTVNGCTMLQGMGVKTPGGGGGGTSITTSGADVALITFPANCDFGGAKDIFFEGYENAAATQDAVTVNSNNLIMRDCQIKGGRYGLNTNNAAAASGACVFDNCYIEGYTGSVLSNNANWYIRCIFDNSLSGTYMFHQVAGGGINEGHFWGCDFSGNTTYSIFLDDPQSIAKFSGCIFGPAIQITRANVTLMTGCEFGSGTFVVGASGGTALVTGSMSLVNLAISGTHILAGNTTNIS